MEEHKNTVDKETRHTVREVAHHKVPAKQSKMDAKQASELVKDKLQEVLNKKSDSTVSISFEEGFWNALVEVVDEEYLAGKGVESMNDILGTYEVKMDGSGTLLSWKKKSTHKRGENVQY